MLDESKSTQLGARPLKRVIQRELQDPMALALLQGDFSEGDKIAIDVRDEALTFDRLQVMAQAA